MYIRKLKAKTMQRTKTDMHYKSYNWRHFANHVMSVSKRKHIYRYYTNRLQCTGTQLVITGTLKHNYRYNRLRHNIKSYLWEYYDCASELNHILLFIMGFVIANWLITKIMLASQHYSVNEFLWNTLMGRIPRHMYYIWCTMYHDKRLQFNWFFWERPTNKQILGVVIYKGMQAPEHLPVA